MDVSLEPNPFLTAGLFSRLFFGWLLPIFQRGRHRELEPKDLYGVLPENLSKPVTDRLENFWKVEWNEAHQNKRKPSLLKAIQKTFQWTFLKYTVHFFFSQLVFKTVQPLAMGLLIWHFDQRSTSSVKEAYCYATAFVLITIFDQLLFNHILFGLRTLGISARVACTSLIFRKIVKLPYLTKQVSIGRIINLMSNDVSKLEFCFLFMHTLWFLPLQLILITYLIWREVGFASLFGVLALIIQTIPVQAFCGRVIARLRRKIAAKTDERLLLTDEIVRGIRVIKMYTWEKPFEQLVFLARRYEIRKIAKAAYLKSSLWAVMAFAQRTPLFLTIVIYVLNGNSVSAYTMFTLVQYFNILHVLTGSFFLRAVNTVSEAIASVKRIQDFLLHEEQEPKIKVQPIIDDKIVISIEGVSASSREKSDVNILQDLNLTIKQKFLYAVVGPVASGKSSFLKLILDELKTSKGKVSVYGELSYSSQEPWLFKGTIKDNILFGEPFDKNTYDTVTKACALLEDFDQMPCGDDTLVGESGVSLSGGQCARVNLARAVYRNADVYLLDDPFSAVDNRVGKRLFEDCINGLLKDKTRIFVTHHLQYIREADEIIFIDNGRVEYQGDFANFHKTNELFQYLNVNENNEDRKEFPEDFSLSDQSTPNAQNEEIEEKDEEEMEKLLDANNKEEIINEKPTDLKKNKISNRKNIYWKYFSAGSCVIPVVALLAFTVTQLLCSGSDYFVAYWTRRQAIHFREANETQAQDSNLSEDLDSYTAIYIYGFLILGMIIMSIVKMLLFSTVCKHSNEKIHNNMATKLIRATMSFFEANDSGRILNRFSKDMGTVDERLQAIMLEGLEYMFIILGIVAQIVIINQWSILVILFMAILFWQGRIIAIKTTRGIMRLEGQAKSPVFSHVKSSFEGLLTIRCCRAQRMICNEFDIYQDNHTAAASISQYALTAYSCWLDMVTLTFTAVLTYCFLLFKDDRTAGADVGLALTQVLTLCGILARGIRLSGDIETQMISVERLFQYTELKQEDSLNEGIAQKPATSWPSQGKIQFDKVFLKYFQEDVPILRNLEFTIDAGAKIGIVGRTGAGKSSLIAALFRLAKVEGTIYIDDVNTKEIELLRLRKKISILPQEPMLFTISLRKNLDPLDEYDDASLWSALQDVELHKLFTSLDVILDQNNLSSGQRQLLCLARAILKKNKILILDEATANVDPNTDALIQKTIKLNFKDCTILMITHRLNIVADCDKIIVLDKGRVMEYDTPDNLLRNENGYFSKMWTQNTIRTSEHVPDNDGENVF